MSFAFRRRNLSCFYCGSRSTQKWSGSAQQWRCKACEAVNYLDKTGQVADPPPQPSPHPSNLVRYARPVSPALHEESETPEAIFCPTCLKNQHILKETLSSYLPPEDAADYDDYIAKYDSYRQHLESRYPQVCPQCAPRAREQIRKSAYIAKTDHLRRMIDRTKTADVLSRSDNFFNHLSLGLAGLAARASPLFQALWHSVLVLALTASHPHERTRAHSDLLLGEDDVKLESPIWTFLEQHALRYNLAHNLAPWMPVALLVSVFTIWWNPRLRAKQLQPSGRLEGLTQFYILQAVSLLARTTAFYKLSPTPSALGVEVVRGLHGFIALFIVVVLVISSKAVRLNTKPLFTFPTQDEPILPHVAQPQTIERPIQQRTRNGQSNQSTPFPIQKLAPAPLPLQQPYDPPTPPPNDENDPDLMDWTPTGKPSALSLNPQARVQQAPSAFQGPSPFHGTLPPAPLAPSHKLRNPAAYNPATFRKASEAQQTSFATTISTPLRRSTRKNPNANPYDSDTTDQTADDDDVSVPGSATGYDTRKRRDMDIAQPKFFLQEDQRDTGLEDMFGTSFDLQDTPRELRPRRVESEEAQSPGWFGWSRRRTKAK